MDITPMSPFKVREVLLELKNEKRLDWCDNVISSKYFLALGYAIRCYEEKHKDLFDIDDRINNLKG